MKVKFLKGSNSDIATQYITSSKNVVKNLKYNQKLNKNIFTRNTQGILKKIFVRGIQNYYSKKFAKNFDEDFSDFIKNISQSAGIKEKKFINLITLPDVLTYIFSKFTKLKIPHTTFGCSSVVKITDNGVIHGRNLDYFGGNVWAKNHELVVVFPEKGLKYATVCSEGFFSPGITSINESLISISLHMLYSNRVNEKGIPILNLVYKVILSSTSLDDVRKILNENKPITGWGLIICDHKTREVSIFELNGKKYMEHKVKSPYEGYVNNYFTTLKKDEFLFSYTWIENNYYRLKRIRELLKENKEVHNILSDRTDPYLSENFIGGFTIANNFTVSSAIFDTTNDTVLVADNKVPASIGTYKSYQLSELFKENIVEKDKVETANLEKVKDERLLVLIDEFDKYMISSNKKKFVRSIEEIGEYPVSIFVAILYAKMKKVRKALEILNKTEGNIQIDEYRKQSIKLLKAIFLDIIREREKSVMIYRELISKNDFPDITYWCFNFLRKSANYKFLERIDINMFLSHFIIA